MPKNRIYPKQLHTKIRFTQICWEQYMVQKSAKEEGIKSKDVIIKCRICTPVYMGL